MDRLSLAGVVVGFLGVLAGQWLEGGRLLALLQVTAFVIVFGGTLGAVMVQTPMYIFLLSLRMIRWVFVPPVMRPEELLKSLVDWSQMARREGLLSLESGIGRQQDPLVRKGLQMLVDGYSADRIGESFHVDIQTYERMRWAAARVWEGAAGYSPTIGMLGAVLGLVHVMEKLGDPSQLGAGIAVAFISTIYGVGFANLFFLPVSNKLKILIQQQMAYYEMLVDGLQMIANGENPHFVKGKLQGYLF